MNRDDFYDDEYPKLIVRVLAYSKKARKEGLLALERYLDQQKIDAHDVFEYGLSLIVDGEYPETVEKNLSDIVAQEKDEYVRLLKTIQMQAILGLQNGEKEKDLYQRLNSLTEQPLIDDTDLDNILKDL